MGPAETLKLNSPLFDGEISGFAPGNTIDLNSVTSVYDFDLVSGNTLDVFYGSDGEASLIFPATSNYDGDNFLFDQDASVGTDITIMPDSGDVAFTAPEESLDVPDPGDFDDVITSFLPGDTLDLTGLFLQSVELVGDQLVATETDDATVALQLSAGQGSSGVVYTVETIPKLSRKNRKPHQDQWTPN